MDSQASARQACRTGDCRVSLGHDGLQHAKKNSLKPHLGKYWKIPPDESGEFVARMEDVLDVCHRPYSAEFPVVCMDESGRQLVGKVTRQMEMSPSHPRLVDGECVRSGVVETFAETEPLTGRQHIRVTDTRTMRAWAEYVREMLDERCPASRKVVLVMDNLNTHSIGSLYEAFPPAEAERPAERLEIHCTPRHGSWLNIAEIELSALKLQCLSRRIPTKEKMKEVVEAWLADRNATRRKIDWQFTTAEARIKLKRLYPVIEAHNLNLQYTRLDISLTRYLTKIASILRAEAKFCISISRANGDKALDCNCHELTAHRYSKQLSGKS